MEKQIALSSRQLAVSRIFVIVLFSNLMMACYQPETGCLDIEAINFEVGADENCGDGDDSETNCPCVFPVFSFKTNYVFDTLEYQPDVFYQVDAQYFRLKSIRFYLSGFQFIRTDGDTVRVEDTIHLTLSTNPLQTEILTDDFLLINEQSSQNIGSVNKSAEYASLRFVVGIEEQANTAIPDSINIADHPLTETGLQTDSPTERYVFNQIIFQKDTLSETATSSLEIFGNTNLVEIIMPFSYKSTIGENFSLGTLKINHAKWFDGIKFATDSDADMIERIVKNTPNVFSITY